jgi:hypothetical protein
MTKYVWRVKTRLPERYLTCKESLPAEDEHLPGRVEDGYQDRPAEII